MCVCVFVCVCFSICVCMCVLESICVLCSIVNRMISSDLICCVVSCCKWNGFTSSWLKLSTSLCVNVIDHGPRSGYEKMFVCICV